MTGTINPYRMANIDAEETFRKVFNLDKIAPSQILGIEASERYDRLIAIDCSSMDQIQQYGLLMQEAKRLDDEYVQEIKEPVVFVGGASGFLGGTAIGTAAGAVFHTMVSRFLPTIGNVESFTKLTCYAVPIILGAKKGYESGKQLAKEFIENQHPHVSKLTAAIWEKEVLAMGSTVVEVASEIGTKKEQLLHMQVEQANLLQKEIQQLEHILDYFCNMLKEANTLNSTLINHYLT
ncbi:MAG: hypothetical protein C5B45_05155 [Chlamydiae bacterium]|nr:MAG: hypothetical protein C5B45_05155 [Chlamydiota bacterium]